MLHNKALRLFLIIVIVLLTIKIANAQDAPVVTPVPPDSGMVPAEFHLIIQKSCGDPNDWPRTHRFAIMALVDLEDDEYIYWFEEDDPATREHALRLKAGEWLFLQREGHTARLTIKRLDNALLQATYSCGYLPGWYMFLPVIEIPQL